MKPTQELLADPRGWRFEWLEFGLQMDVHPLSAGRDATEAEITMRAISGEVWGHMHQGRVDLASTRSKEILARFLRSRGSGRVNWGDIVEQASVLTLRAIRGTPTVARPTRAASDLMALQLPQPRAIIDGVLTEGVWILGGRPKSGKSWAALGFGVAIAAGGYALGNVAVEGGDVLYLALEDSELRLQSRLAKSLNGEPAPARLHCATEWPRLDVGGLDELRVWLAGHPQTRLVIIDTLARARGRSNRGNSGRLYDEDYEALEGLADLARAARVCVLVLHHLRKGGADDPVEALSGTMGLGGAADGIIELARRRGSNHAVLKIVGRDMPGDRELAIEWDEALAQWNLVGDAGEVILSRQRQAILDALTEAGEPLAPKDLAEVTEIQPGAMRRLLWAMAKSGQVERAGYGKYSASDRGVTEVIAPPSDHLAVDNRRYSQKQKTRDQGDQAITSPKSLSDSTDYEPKSDRPPNGQSDHFPAHAPSDRVIAPISLFAHDEDTEPPEEAAPPLCPGCSGRLTSDGVCWECQDRPCVECGYSTGSTLRSRCPSCAAKAAN